MRYCLLANVLSEPFKSYHFNLVSSIAEHFPNLIETKEQAIPTHFTLKYDFDADNITQLETTLERFAKMHKPKPISIGGFDKFGEDVVFVKVNLLQEARESFIDFLKELEQFPWMQWQQHDGENLRFHSTIAEECGKQNRAVLEFIKDKEQYFKSYFDNVTIFIESGRKTEHGYRIWEVYKRFDFGQ